MKERFSTPHDEVIGPDGVQEPVDIDELMDQLAAAQPAPNIDKVVKVQTHGELGPVLTRPGDKFTSENDLPG